MKNTIPTASKLAIAEIKLATGEARFLKRDCYISACEVHNNAAGTIRLSAGFENTKDNLRAARRWLAVARESERFNWVDGAEGRHEWALLPYSPRALAEWTGKMAKRVNVKPDYR